MRKMGEKLFLCRGTDAYDKQLNELCLSTELRPFFGVLHPELLPYVGQNYKKTGILLVGESHYVEKATMWKKPLLSSFDRPIGTTARFPQTGHTLSTAGKGHRTGLTHVR